jgi:CBS domain-containing protein
MKLHDNVTVLMQTDLITVQRDTPIEKVQELLSRRGVHHLLVEDDDGQLLGIVSTADLRKRASVAPFPRGHEAQHLMTPAPIKIDTSTTLLEALDLFLENNIRSLPVVNSEGVAHGIVTPYDFLAWLRREADVS